MKAARAESPQRPPRICHGGTLDPFASGLLLVLIEPATRLFNYLHDVPKVYEATIRWGSETHSGDLLGETIATGDPSNLSKQMLEDALPKLIGWQEQIPPATSAKWVDGQRAYKRVHRGEPVVMKPVQVYLHEARWLEHDLPHQSRIRISVRGGYYVRALARDLGRTFGCYAHLGSLHRTAIGPWSDPGPERTVAMHGRDVLPWAEARILTDQEVGQLRERKSIPAGVLLPPEWNVPSGFPQPTPPIRGMHQDRFLYLLERDGDALKVVAPLKSGI